MVTLVNFSDSNYKLQQKWNSFTGKFIGKFDHIINYSINDIDTKFLELNIDKLEYSKGFGNYFWKAYLINKALERVNDGDYLFYSDSGSIFIKSIKPLIKVMNEMSQNILCFHTPFIEKQWTKRDTFVLMNCDEPRFSNTAQILSGFVFIKKDSSSVSFFKEYEKHSLDSRIITDMPNTQGVKNYAEFIAHRHDQSIFSLMCKSKGLKSLPDISDYGCLVEQYQINDDYIFDNDVLEAKHSSKDVIVLSNRKAHPLIYLCKYVTKLIFRKLRV